MAEKCLNDINPQAGAHQEWMVAKSISGEEWSSMKFCPSSAAHSLLHSRCTAAHLSTTWKHHSNPHLTKTHTGCCASNAEPHEPVSGAQNRTARPTLSCFLLALTRRWPAGLGWLGSCSSRRSPPRQLSPSGWSPGSSRKLPCQHTTWPRCLGRTWRSAARSAGPCSRGRHHKTHGRQFHEAWEKLIKLKGKPRSRGSSMRSGCTGHAKNASLPRQYVQ